MRSLFGVPKYAFLVLALALAEALAAAASMAAKTKVERGEPMPARAEVELDIYSGMPNPTWTLTNAEADSLVERLAALPPISPSELSGNLGYRGFIVRVTRGEKAQLIHIQIGNVHIVEGRTNRHSEDKDRALERWLLNTGRIHLERDIVEMVRREVG